jgi:oxygen-independent coproporphyrinogen-3 oxidase
VLDALKSVLQFTESFGCADYSLAARESNAEIRPLSLYFHLPFCATLCYYCACNKIATRKRNRADEYLDCLIREIELQSELYEQCRPVRTRLARTSISRYSRII